MDSPLPDTAAEAENSQTTTSRPMGLAAVPCSAYKLGVAAGALRSAMQSLTDCQGYLKLEYAKLTTPEEFKAYTKAEMAAFRKIRDGINEMWALIEWEEGPHLVEPNSVDG